MLTWRGQRSASSQERCANLEGPEACKDTEEAGLAAAVGPHNHDGRAWWDFKGQVPHQGRAIWTVQCYPGYTSTDSAHMVGRA